MENFKHKPYQMFLLALGDELGKPLLSTGEDSLMQYESNYLNALMMAHPDVLERTMHSYQEEMEGAGYFDGMLPDTLQYLIENLRFPWSY